jgi:hypothetical protein
MRSARPERPARSLHNPSSHSDRGSRPYVDACAVAACRPRQAPAVLGGRPPTASPRALRARAPGRSAGPGRQSVKAKSLPGFWGLWSAPCRAISKCYRAAIRRAIIPVTEAEGGSAVVDRVLMMASAPAVVLSERQARSQRSWRSAPTLNEAWRSTSSGLSVREASGGAGTRRRPGRTVSMTTRSTADRQRWDLRGGPRSPDLDQGQAVPSPLAAAPPRDRRS